ncbi:MAG: GTPase HflX [Candidatus Fermentibacteraceae bacterium]|nr:GTPase HflX [Candidatus Fermentibacteraceae bacterium]MBN2609692.1 GTPase HflX [Candidatus Fermentibacteraceae bacterium]
MNQTKRDSTDLERVLLMRVFIGTETDEGSCSGEMRALVASAGGTVVAEDSQRKESPDPRLFIGRGKAEELRDTASDEGVSTIVFDHNLSSGQVARLEEVTECKVIDRTELILAIFAGRARTREAKLQIELAQLKYSLPRLSGMWHHFSRLGAGIGTRGPGETQLEIDRRRARARISLLEERIREVESRWRIVSESRRGMYNITIVGYTNAGKSTLLNTLCDAGLYTADKPFATLDTTSRRMELPDGSRVLISDTVGFIERLPETLVASFHTTLDVARKTDLLLVAVDRSSPWRGMHIDAVRETLDRIGVDKSVPRLTVWTKCDAVPDEAEPRSGVAISSHTGMGLDMLLQRIMKCRDDSIDWFELVLDHHDSGLIHWLYTNCVVRDVTDSGEDGSVRVIAGALRGYDSVEGRLEGSGLIKLFRRLGGPEDNWIPG